MAESEDYSATEIEDICIDDPLLLSTKKGDKKRKFSEEQVKSLELMFETQTKLEPRKKLELAKDLGLHPRQVAIWFQNKRARWKSKQLEREYGALKADYDALLSKFESLKNEKQLLSKQLQKLAELIEDQKSACSDEDQKLNLFPTERKEMRLMSTSNVANEELSPFENSMVPTEQQFCFHQTNWPSEQSSMTQQWWEFWPMNE